jgi:hypothetical protein
MTACGLVADVTLVVPFFISVKDPIDSRWSQNAQTIGIGDARENYQSHDL